MGHVKIHLGVLDIGSSLDEAYKVQVPYTETINHPEQGHWEYR